MFDEFETRKILHIYITFSQTLNKIKKEKNKKDSFERSSRRFVKVIHWNFVNMQIKVYEESVRRMDSTNITPRFVVSIHERGIGLVKAVKDTKGHQGEILDSPPNMSINDASYGGDILNNTLVVAETNIVTICLQFNLEYCILIRFVTDRRRENIKHSLSNINHATIYGTF